MTQFLDVADVVQLHDTRAPGAPLIDTAKLDGALHRPRNVEVYEPDATIHGLAAVLFEGIIAAHAFEDGNKRAAVLSVYAFYALNGWAFDRAGDSDLIHLAVDVATGDADAQKAAAYFEQWVTPLPDS